MSEIPKVYEPQSVEDKWYDFWVKQGCFTADPARVSPKRPAYSIVIPPPNVTGMLHMGHVLNNTIQDILSRKARMDGKEVLWLPGTDHAGIATEGMVAKQLRKEEKKTKQEIGREEFLKRVWTWKDKHGGIITSQLRKLGCSCDWTRERFTMDPDYVRCVQRVFVDLYQKGLIYRGKRMVNWCPATQTALSDEEVEMKPQKGFLYHFRVEAVEADGSPVAPAPASPAPAGEAEPGTPEKPPTGPVIDSDGRTWLTIATTRPETIPGDAAVAVHPKDPRYAHLIGKHVVRPLPIQIPRGQKLIPIIADDYVDREFGSGVLKVTPAHDVNDFAIGQRHQLPFVDIMNPDGSMNDKAGESLSGLDRFEARAVAVERLKEIGAIVREDPYENKVGFSQRADVPIEPRLSEQWFLKYPSVGPSTRCVAEGLLAFHPDRWAKVYDHWLSNIQDWCISRQLWWGHRVPVWYRANPGPHDPRKSSQENLDNNPSIETVCQVDRPEGAGWEQDPDVLDTWFSSWLWPFATMGWTGEKSQDSKNPTLQVFYPTTDLVTGPDIIFFWVARMIMAGYEYMGDLPFRNVYFTGIIRDKQGRKMSKTLGNSPDPLDLIAKYGADALRFGTMRSAPLGQDVLFDEKDVELGRNFCTKLWNACRFRQMQGGEVQAEIDPARLTSDDKWILLKLDRAIAEVTNAFAEYRFNEVTQTLYRVFWAEYCDWYVEATKAVFQATDAAQKANTLAVMDFVLSHLLRLFHPFLPFITEELWHGLGYAADMPEDQGGRTIMFAPWPKPLGDDFKRHYGIDESDEKVVDAKYDLIGRGRNLRREFNIAANKKVRFIFKAHADPAAHDLEVIRLLLNAETVQVDRAFVAPKGTPGLLCALGELFMPLEGLVDVAAERTRLEKEKVRISAEVDKVLAKLSNPDFVQRVPPAVLEEHQKRLADWREKLQRVQDALEGLSGS